MALCCCFLLLVRFLFLRCFHPSKPKPSYGTHASRLLSVTALDDTQITAVRSKRVLFLLPQRIHLLPTFFFFGRTLRASLYFRFLVFVFFCLSNARLTARRCTGALSFKREGKRCRAVRTRAWNIHSVARVSPCTHCRGTRLLSMLSMATEGTLFAL